MGYREEGDSVEVGKDGGMWVGLGDGNKGEIGGKELSRDELGGF